MNAAVVLIALLLAVPAQLILSHYMEQLVLSDDSEGEGSEGGEGVGVGGDKGVRWRQDAVERYIA